MVEITEESIIISLEEFTKEEVQESALALLQAQYLQQENLSTNPEEQRGYYLLIELLKAISEAS